MQLQSLTKIWRRLYWRSLSLGAQEAVSLTATISLPSLDLLRIRRLRLPARLLLQQRRLYYRSVRWRVACTMQQIHPLFVTFASTFSLDHFLIPYVRSLFIQTRLTLGWPKLWKFWTYEFLLIVGAALPKFAALLICMRITRFWYFELDLTKFCTPFLIFFACLT